MNCSLDAGMGSASLDKHNSIGFGVVEVVGGPLYTHFLEYEFLHLNFINNGTNILGKSSQVQIVLKNQAYLNLILCNLFILSICFGISSFSSRSLFMYLNTVHAVSDHTID